MLLRDYQQRAVSAVRAALVDHRSVCLAMQVGAGKTSVAGEIIRLAVQRGRRALFVVHRIELVHQAAGRLQAFGIEPGIIKAGFTPQPRLPVQVACVPTLIRRTMPPADLVILDECHHGVSESWQRVVEHYRASGAYVVGITATPLRLDGKPLGRAFETIIEPVTTRELVDGGYLIAPTVYAPPVDLRGVPKRLGDYSIPELAERMSPLCGHVVNDWVKHAQGLRTVAFAVNIKHSLLIEDGFRRVGARVEHIDGKTPPKQRARVNAMLSGGDLDVVTQCSLWVEGVDIPELGCIVVARPTKSLSLHRQMIGRVMRPSAGKTRALVLDHAGNYHEHGSILDEIEWSLEGPARRKSDAAAVRTCKECFAVLLPGAEACQECGAVVSPDERGGRETPGIEGEGELVIVDAAPGRRANAQDKLAEYTRIVEEASRSGRKIGWARHKFKAWCGSWPRERELEVCLYKCPGKVLEDTPARGGAVVRRCANCLQTLGWVRHGAYSPNGDRFWHGRTDAEASEYQQERAWLPSKP